VIEKMMEKSIEDLPFAFVQALKTLGNDESRKILLYLLEKGEASYTELLKTFSIIKGKLNYHLKKLASAGLIRRYYREGKDYPHHSFYEPTNLAKKLIEAIIQTYMGKGPPEYQFPLTSSYDLSLKPMQEHSYLKSPLIMPGYHCSNSIYIGAR
jgi:DNA-binding transcriptional ArsR family regulator